MTGNDYEQLQAMGQQQRDAEPTGAIEAALARIEALVVEHISENGYTPLTIEIQAAVSDALAKGARE